MLSWYSGTLVALVIVFSTLPVSAQEVTPLPYQGTEGVWFPLADARVALSARVERDSLRERLRLTEESLTIADAQAENLRALLATATAQIEDAATRVESAIGRAVRAETERDAWYRNPFFWGIVGLVVGAGGVLAAILASGA